MTLLCHKRLYDTALLLIIPTFMAFACQQGAASGHEDQRSSDSSSSATTMSHPNADSTIHVRANEIFDIRLRCAAGQGYSWQLLDSSFTDIRQDRSQTFENLPHSKAGSDGIQIFHFRALKPGKETIQLIYVQPYNKPYPKDAPHKTYLVDIR